MLNIRSFGAQGDGITDDSEAIRAAVAACKSQGYGTVYVPAGVYCSGPINFVSNMTLHLELGAEIRFIPEFDRYCPVHTRWEGVECFGMHPLIFGAHLENVAITGQGTLNGMGAAWWDEVHKRRAEKRLRPESVLERELARLNPGYETAPSGGGGREMQFLRPPLIQFFDCRSVLIEGITAKDSPFWTVHPVYCEDLTIRAITVVNPAGAPNTDGLDIDSCSNVRISDCTFDVGDDCCCLKSGSGPDGIRVGRPTENVQISNCFMYRGHGGVVIGSETAGGVRNVVVTNCIFTGTDRGIRIKTRRGRGGEISSLIFSSLIMQDVICPIVINMFYRCGAREEESLLFVRESQPLTHTTPYIHDILFCQLIVRGARATAGFVVGLPERPIENLVLTDCTISVEPDELVSTDEVAMECGLPTIQSRGIRIAHVRHGSLQNVRVHLDEGQPVIMEDNAEVEEIIA